MKDSANKPHEPQNSGRVLPLLASTGLFIWQSPFALAPLRAEHPLCHGEMVSAHQASTGSTCCCCIYRHLFLCSSHLHAAGLFRAHPYPCQQAEISCKHLCGEAIYLTCIFLAEAGHGSFCSVNIAVESCGQGRGQSQGNGKLIYIAGCSKRIALNSGRKSQFIVLPFISGRVTTRTLIPGLMAPGWQLVLPCPSINYYQLIKASLVLPNAIGQLRYFSETCFGNACGIKSTH